MELYTGQLRKCKFNNYPYKNKLSNNDICTFDIETTSYWIENGKVIPYQPYRKGVDKEGKVTEYDWNQLEAGALCYIWQFGFNDNVYYGRELESFLQLLNDLPTYVNFIIWVHNLAFEFHFLLNIINFTNVFARTARKPIKACSNQYPNIEFRCSYMLTRLSLANWGKKIGYEKKVGDLDYSIIRTPLTPITKTELGYCESDCLVMYYGLLEYRKKYKTMGNIPLTQTGTVRRVIKNILMEDYRYNKFVKRLVPKNADEYYILQKIFAGGYTHANRMYSMATIKGLIEHYDFASSYPFVILTEKFPCNPWSTAVNKIPDDSEFDEYAFLMHLRFTKLDCQTANTYIQYSKSRVVKVKNNPVVDNGRVVTADLLDIWVTEQDWLTIKETYTADKVEVLECKKSRKQYLNRKFLLYILELYKNKTSLKDVEGMEAIYMESKEQINSLFGMMVTAIMQADIFYSKGDWTPGKLTEKMINERLEELRRWGKSEDRYFLSYSWGCYVTAYARRNLWKCIIPNDLNTLYCDTDSIFLLGKQNFDWYNKEVEEKIRKSCEANDLKFEDFSPKTIKGVPKMIGIFAKEEDCIEFRTLGAKRYVERRKKDKKLYLTVSGINKEAVALLDNNIDNFKDGFNFDRDDSHVKKKLLIYLNEMTAIKFPDGYVQKYGFGINLRNNGYHLSITDEYDNLVKFTKFCMAEQREEVLNQNRNIFIPSSILVN